MGIFKPFSDPKEAFETYGFGIGGVLPIFLAVVHEFLLGFAHRPFYALSVGFLAMGIFTFVTLRRLDDNHRQFKTISTIISLIQAICSMLIIHFFVAYFGGVKESVFAFSYLYLPAVVGFVIGGTTLWVTTLLCGVLFLHNALDPDWMHRWFALQNPAIATGSGQTSGAQAQAGWLYITVFMIQLAMTAWLAPRDSMANSGSSE